MVMAIQLAFTFQCLKSMIDSHNLSLEKHAKPVCSSVDLHSPLMYNWCFDREGIVHEKHRVQATLLCQPRFVGPWSTLDWADPGGASGSVLVVATGTEGEAVAEARGRRARRVAFSMGGAGAHGVPNVGKGRSTRGCQTWRGQKHTRVPNRGRSRSTRGCRT